MPNFICIIYVCLLTQATVKFTESKIDSNYKIKNGSSSLGDIPRSWSKVNYCIKGKLKQDKSSMTRTTCGTSSSKMSTYSNYFRLYQPSDTLFSGRSCKLNKTWLKIRSPQQIPLLLQFELATYCKSIAHASEGSYRSKASFKSRPPDIAANAIERRGCCCSCCNRSLQRQRDTAPALHPTSRDDAMKKPGCRARFCKPVCRQHMNIRCKNILTAWTKHSLTSLPKTTGSVSWKCRRLWAIFEYFHRILQVI